MTSADNLAMDRLGIEAAIRNYAYGLDERRFDAWDLAFTADAIIDFTPMGGAREPISAMRQRLEVADSTWLFAQHPVINTIITFDGDAATAHSEYIWESGRRPDVDGQIVRVSGGGSYDDVLHRTDAGWRIHLRTVRLKWKHTQTVADEVARR